MQSPMAQKGRDCVVFVDTNLHTHLAIPASSLDTISHIKRKLVNEHSKCFGQFGQIEVHALKVKRQGKLYSLSDSMPLTTLFTGTLKAWFLSADISAQFCHNEVIAGASHLQRGYEKSGNDINSTALVPFVNPVNKSVNAGSLEKDSADVGGADPNDIKVKDSSETNHFESLSAEPRSGSGADKEHLEDPHSEEKEGIESHGRDMNDLSTGSDKTKGTANKNNTRITKLQVMSDDKFIGSDASANVSDKSLATPLGHQLKAIDISELSCHVQCNYGTVIPTNMDEAVTEEDLGRVGSVPDAKGSEKEVGTDGSLLESGMKRSKKIKNSGGDVSHQMDIKGKKELGLRENGDMRKGTKMLAEPELTRPLKKSKSGNGTPVAIVMDGVEDGKSGILSSKQQNQTPKHKKKTKQKLTPAVKNVSESGTKNQSDTTFPEKSKANLSKSASGIDNNDETLSSTHKKMDKVLPVLTTEVDTEMSAKVFVTNHASEISSTQEADETIQHSAESMKLTSVQKRGRDKSSKTEKSKKKLKQKPQQMKSISELPVKDNSTKSEGNRPTLSRSEVEKAENESLSSSAKKINNVSLISSSQSDKDQRAAPVEVYLNVAKNIANIVNPKVESSFLEAINNDSVINGNASTCVGNTNDSRTSSIFLDMLNKMLHHRKSLKDLQNKIHTKESATGKAKLIGSQSQLEEDESQDVDFVPESEPDN